jgi:hypothetical protein
MTHKKILAASLFLASALSGLLLTGAPPGTPAVRAEKVYSGQVCTVAVQKLTSDIKWQTKLNLAEDEAQKENKLVFWMHMLGKIDGAT